MKKEAKVCRSKPCSKAAMLVLVVMALAVIMLLAGCQIKLPGVGSGNETAGEEITGEAISDETGEVDEGLDNVSEAIDELPEEETGVEVETSEETSEETATEITEELETTEDTVPTKTVVEGDLVSFPNLAAKDPEGDPLAYIFSSPLDEDGEWQTKVGDAGTYFANITVSDGINEVTQQVKIVVKNANRQPVIQLASSAIAVKEGETVKILPTATDPDGDKVTVTYSGWMTASSYKTTYNDAGEHKVTITASDGAAESTAEVTVTVANVNRAPVVTQIQDLMLDEGDKVTLLPVAQDSDGDKLSFVFSEPFDERGVWQTKAGDAGKYRVNVTVSDGELADSMTFFIVVQPANQPPVITGLAELTVDEGQKITLDFTVTDAENDTITTAITGWMTAISYQTTYDDAGAHEVTVSANDGTSATTKTIKITVNDKNRPPVFNPGSFN